MKNKTTTGFLIILFSLFFCGFTSNETYCQNKDKDRAESGLKDKIEKLEKKMQEQQTEIDSLKKEIGKLKESQPFPALPGLKNNDHFRKGKPFQI